MSVRRGKQTNFGAHHGNRSWPAVVVGAAAVVLVTLSPGCSSLGPVELPDETAMAPADTALWAALGAERSEDWFVVLNTGNEALEWRLRLIDSAVQSLDLQTFLWMEDTTGLTILRHLVEAADRGVRVRLLLDDTCTTGENDMIWDIDQHPNIEYRIYNPFGRRYDSYALRQLMSLGEFSRLDHRMHNKVMVADNRAAIVGGRNLADEYFGNHETANFRDMEVLTGGALVQAISSRFDDYWNSNWSIPVDRILDVPPSEMNPAAYRTWLEKQVERGLVEPHQTRHERWIAAARAGLQGTAVILADDPAQADPASVDELPNQLAHDLLAATDRAKEELILVSAYLIPTPELEAAIERAEARGVQVRILTNSLRSNNHTAAHSAYRHHLHRLLDHGADLHEVRARAKDRDVYMVDPVDDKELGLHAKVLLIDDDHTFIGSANLDPRSLHLNTEIGLLIQSAEMNRRVREHLALDFDPRNAWRLERTEQGVTWIADDETLATQPAHSRFHRLEDWFLGLLPIEPEM